MRRLTKSLRSLACGLVGLQLAMSSPAFAEDGASHPPPDAKLDQLAAFYAPQQERLPYDGIAVERDVKYGPAERNLLDIFTPASADSAPRPVLLFVHGGGFTAGERRFAHDLPFYDNVAVWAVRHRLIGVNMTYRLAPEFGWPAGAEDIGAAIRYLRGAIASRGGDPKRIYVMGHSAGAVHVAAYLAHPEMQPPDGPGVAGGILVSGAFDIATLPIGEREKAYFGSDPTRYAERSSLEGLVHTRARLLVVNAEHDPPMFLRQADELKAALARVDRPEVKTLVLVGHSHMSTVMSINSRDTALAQAIAGFLGDDATP